MNDSPQIGCRHLPIFPGRHRPSILGVKELNFRVRNGNGWTLALISTNLLSFEKESKQRKLHTPFYKKSSVSFSLLTVFFNSKYSIKFLSHCQELFVLNSAARKGGPQIANQRSVCDLERKNKRSLGELSASAGSEPCAVYF